VADTAIAPLSDSEELTATEAMLRSLDESQMLALLKGRSPRETASARYM